MPFFGRMKQGEKPDFPGFGKRNRTIGSSGIPNPIIRRPVKHHVLSVMDIGKLRFVHREDFEGAAVKSARVAILQGELAVRETPAHGEDGKCDGPVMPPHHAEQ